MKAKLIFFILSILPFLATACSCAWIQSFCETIAPQSDVSTVKIIERFTSIDSFGLTQTYFLVETIEDLIGFAPKDTMTILASYGTTCDANIYAFESGDSMVVQISTPTRTLGSIPYDFALSGICSRNFLKLENNKIHDGKSDDRDARFDYSDFKTNLLDCSKLTILDDSEFLDKVVFLYPNPANDLLNVGFHFNTTSDYQIFDVRGRLISENETANSVHEINLSNLENGVYFIKIMVNEVFAIRKFVKL